MLLNEILSQIPELAEADFPQIRIEGIAYDSRRVKRGDLFVGIKGQKADGAKFVGQAVARGASAVVTETAMILDGGIPALQVRDARRFLAVAARVFFHDPASQMTLAAITGTNGKTTTSYLVDAIFRRAGLSSCLVGTIGMRIGRQQLPADRTTPECPDLLSFLRRAILSGCTCGTVEVSSHALALKRVFDTRFVVGVFTNLTQDHLDFHHDMESYYLAKRLLFISEGQNRVATAVVNVDDPYGRRLASEATCRVLRYGFDPSADIRAVACGLHPDRTELEIRFSGESLNLRTRLLGRPNAYNVMAAAGAALGAGLDHEAIRSGIESVEGVPGRMEPVVAGQPFLIIVDYAHTPDALVKMLETVRGLTKRRVITVFGCGGDRDRGKRSAMGEIAARLSDMVITTSDNPRTEDPLAILSEIEPGLKRGTAAYDLVPDRRDAIALAISRAREGDTVVIAGKGHESYQVIGTQSFPFDDRAVARDLARGFPGSQEVHH